jgi:hypothetical protein
MDAPANRAAMPQADYTILATIEQHGTMKRLALMEYDIKPHEEAYDATTAGIFIVLMLVVTLLLLVFPS